MSISNSKKSNDKVVKRCIDGSFNHLFTAFVDEEFNVTEKCEKCLVSYFYDDPKPQWLIDEIKMNKK